MKPVERHEPAARSDPPEPRAARLPHRSPERVPRRERELVRHRQELLEATERLLATKPLPELTVADIAAESEFSVGYIYKLFPCKEEVLAALIRSKLGELRHAIEGAAQRYATWQDRASAFARETLEWSERGPGAYRLGVAENLREFATYHPAVAPVLAEFMTFYRTAIDELFSKTVRYGQLSEHLPGEIALTFRALIAGFWEERMLHRNERTPASDVARHIVRVIQRAFAVEGGGV